MTTRPKIGDMICILIDEGGAPPGSVVEVTGWSTNPDEGLGLWYKWDGIDNWIVSDNTDEEKFYSVEVDNNQTLLNNAAQQFVVAYEAGELYPEVLEYFHDVFKTYSIG